jgi:acyl-CoA thioesterase-1
VLGAVALAGAGRARAAEPPVVTLFGDSIVAGYGLATAEGLSHQLQLALAALGVAAEVRNAGVPGDPSTRGLARLNASVRKDTALCVVEFGGNDRRLGLPAAITHEALDAIVKVLKARGVSVVIVGFGDGPRGVVQRQVAEENGVAFYPNLFAGVGPGMWQTDEAHPNATGAKVMAKGLAPLVAEGLRARGPG